MKKKVADPRYARSPSYRKVIEAIVRAGKCPFCPKYFKHHQNPILRRHGTWFITESTWPYPNTQHHFLIINTVHKERFDQVTARDFASIFALLRWAQKEFEIPGGGFAMRFGDTSYTGATVCHLHAHLIVPLKNQGSDMAKTVLFPIG